MPPAPSGSELAGGVEESVFASPPAPSLPVPLVEGWVGAELLVSGALSNGGIELDASGEASVLNAGAVGKLGVGVAALPGVVVVPVVAGGLGLVAVPVVVGSVLVVAVVVGTAVDESLGAGSGTIALVVMLPTPVVVELSVELLSASGSVAQASATNESASQEG
jgi:hypothetical protein